MYDTLTALSPFAFGQNSESGEKFSTRHQKRPKHRNMVKVKHQHKVAKRIARAKR